jgi:hypothetical protein
MTVTSTFSRKLIVGSGPYYLATLPPSCWARRRTGLTPVLPDGLDQHLFQLYFPLKQVYREFSLGTNI